MNHFQNAFRNMSDDMKGKLGNYRLSLEHRFGDPAAYAAQRQEMAAQRAVVQYSESKTQEEILSRAYGDSRDRIREEHRARFNRTAPDKLPESQAVS